MSSDQHNNIMFHEEAGRSSSRSRSSSSRRSNGKGPKKPPQRGLGVAQLERLRLQMNHHHEGSSAGGVVIQVPTQLHDHHHHFHHHQQQQQQQQLFQCHPPPPNVGFQFQCHQQHVISGSSNNNNNNIAGGSWNMLPNRVVGCSYGSGPPLLVGTPLESSSKELSSIPNLHSQPHQHCFDFRLKKTRFNEDNEKESNARRERGLEIWPNSQDFLGFMPQPSAPRTFAAASAPNLDECVEVVAVHRRGNSSGSSRILMEYDFFPAKDGSDTTSKELEFPPMGLGGEASSTITAAAYGDSASNYIDLSLKLSR